MKIKFNSNKDLVARIKSELTCATVSYVFHLWINRNHPTKRNAYSDKHEQEAWLEFYSLYRMVADSPLFKTDEYLDARHEFLNACYAVLNNSPRTPVQEDILAQYIKWLGKGTDFDASYFYEIMNLKQFQYTLQERGIWPAKREAVEDVA